MESTDWLCATFGFEVRLRIGEHRAQLAYGDGAVILTELRTLEEACEDHGVMVRVEDVDAHYATAVEGGAEILREPETYEYGERQYVALDLDGHEWTFTQSVDDADPGEWGAATCTWSWTRPSRRGASRNRARCVTSSRRPRWPAPRPRPHRSSPSSRRTATRSHGPAIDRSCWTPTIDPWRSSRPPRSGSAAWRTSTTSSRSTRARATRDVPTGGASHERYWNGYLDDLRTRLGDPSFRLGDDTLVVAERFRIAVELDPDSPR